MSSTDLQASIAHMGVAARASATAMARAGVDVVVLQDGSASMHVKDVPGNRWERSMDWIRSLGDALSWQDDRVALAVFAHVATPQIRLTRDPNTVFFFVDHLHAKPRPIQELVPDCPDPLWKIILHCLEKDPNRRFQDVAELAGALGPFAPARVHGVLHRPHQGQFDG